MNIDLKIYVSQLLRILLNEKRSNPDNNGLCINRGTVTCEEKLSYQKKNGAEYEIRVDSVSDSASDSVSGLIRPADV